MGQGLSVAAQPGGSVGIDVPELSDITFEKSLGTARLMKCMRARHQDGLVVVKVVMKPLPTLELTQYVKAIRSERTLLLDVINALGYQRILETSTNGYLVRQYFYSSLYDRLSTRPFLEEIEKKWLAYQLLCAIRDSHAREVYHGDIKTENILVTSWNWLYLTDFSTSYKPTFLPEDNPAEFSYYFDTSGRRTCYLAPERFLGVSESANGRHADWAMDVFSAGCVIAELFTEAPIFNLSQLFKYKNGEFDPHAGYLKKIQDENVRDLVGHMIAVSPESRYSADEYLNFWRRRAFPEYFYSFLHHYMGSITDPSSGRSAVHPESTNFGEADDRIDKLYYDFDKISYFLGYNFEPTTSKINIDQSQGSDQIIPVHIDLPNNRHTATALQDAPADDGSLIFLTLVVSSLRHTARASSKIRACDLMLAFAERITDEAKLDRILPYLVTLLNDRVDSVKIASLRALTQLLSLIRTVSPVNAYAFTEYIKPRLQHFTGIAGTKASGPIARATYASCLSSLAGSALKIIDMVQALHADGSIPTVNADAEDGIATHVNHQNSFDSARADLLDFFEMHTKALLTDRQASVRRALLGSVTSLCVFFGSARASDVVLSHLNTYLNDKDWILKCAFFRTIVGVGTFVGGSTVEEYILPLMIQSLNDAEEFVIREVLSSCASMAELGLFQRSKTWELVDICTRYAVHPNVWIREAATRFVASSAQYLTIAEWYCLVEPLVQPYLKVSIADMSEVNILDALQDPIPRSAFDLALKWAASAKKGLFWKPARQSRTFSFTSLGLTLPMISSKDLPFLNLDGIERNGEDDQWIRRLRECGLVKRDDFKLLALREYILRLSSQSKETTSVSISLKLEEAVFLKDLQITPQTIFFEETKTSRQRRRASDGKDGSNSRSQKAGRPSHTITDALLDASSTAADPISLRNVPLGIDGTGPINSKARSTPPSRVGRETLMLEATSSGSPRPPRSAPSPLKPSDLTSATGQNPSLNDTDLVGSDGTVTPSGSLKTSNISERTKLHHKSSAIHLLNRRDTSKTPAETGTIAANATGTLEGPSIGRRSPAQTKAEPSGSVGIENEFSVSVSHSYTGNDPTVLHLLDSLASETFQIDVADFGPQVAPVRQQSKWKKTDEGDGELPWRPRGTLVATFGEHTSTVNRVLPSPDHAFFITGADDGTVKIWDTLRLERNLTHRSRPNFIHATDSGVKALAFIENTHTFVSAAMNGSIKVVRVEYSLSGETAKYGKPRVVRDFNLPTGEHATWLDHAKTDNSSLLLVATSACRILAMDLKAMTELYVLQNPVHHGTPTCLCANHKQGWLVVGTSHGVLDLWDLRFHVRLKAWSLAGGKPIHRVAPSPFHARPSKICVAGGTGQTDVTFWDLEKIECSEVFRVGASRGSGKDNVKAYEPWKVDDDKPEGMLGRFATAIDPSNEGEGKSDNGILAMVVGMDSSNQQRSGASAGYLLTGGRDRKVRYWNYPSTIHSSVVSGLEAEEAQPKYVTQPTSSLTLHTERISQQGGGGHEIGSKAKRSSKQPRNTVISLQQQALLRNHLDEITDVCLLESPVRMVVSVDRMGCIHVFQ